MPLPGLVGRDAELALLRQLLDSAVSGRGNVLLVTGEAGIGKSRLLQEADELAQGYGLLVLRGRAVESGGTYRPVAQALLSSLRGSRLVASEELRPYRAALGRLLPDWSEAPADAGGGGWGTVDPVLVLGEGVLRLLRSIGGAAGCLLVLEDLHWADADTLALVEYLAGAVRDSPVLVAASARDDWPGATVDRLSSDEDVTTLRLARLSLEEVGALAASRVGGEVPEPVRRLLADRSDGVPFLVVELLAESGGSFETGADEPRIVSMPRTFAEMVAQRLDLLTAHQRRFLSAAAVLGTDPDWSLLARVSEVDESESLAAMRGAAAAHLLVADEGRLRWRHSLTREAVLATLVPPERAALARAAAEALLDRRGPDDETTAAALLCAAGEHDAAAAILLRLAHQDLTRGALHSADALLDRVTSMQARPASVAIERVLLLTLTGRPLAALERGAVALEAATGDQHAELSLRLARAAIAAGRWTDAERYVERAGRPNDPRSSSMLADAAHGSGRVQAAALHAAAAVEQAEREGRPNAICEALVIAAKVDRLRDLTASVAGFRRAAQVAAEHGLAPWRVEALLGIGTLELLGTETSSSLPQVRELALDAGLLAQVAQVDVLLAEHVLLADGPGAGAAAGPEAARRGDTSAPDDRRNGRAHTSSRRLAPGRAMRNTWSPCSAGFAIPHRRRTRRHSSYGLSEPCKPTTCRERRRCSTGVCPRCSGTPLRRHCHTSGSGSCCEPSRATGTRWPVTVSGGSQLLDGRPTAARSTSPTPSLTAALVGRRRPGNVSLRVMRRCPRCRGFEGCCACSHWKLPSSTAGGTRCPHCARILLSTSAPMIITWPEPAGTCSAAPACWPGVAAANPPSHRACGRLA